MATKTTDIPGKVEPSKPQVTMYDVDNDVSVGDKVTITGTIKRVTTHEDGTECVVECDELSCDGDEEGLDGAMKKIAKKKSAVAEDDAGDDE